MMEHGILFWELKWLLPFFLISWFFFFFYSYYFYFLQHTFTLLLLLHTFTLFLLVCVLNFALNSCLPLIISSEIGYRTVSYMQLKDSLVHAGFRSNFRSESIFCWFWSCTLVSSKGMHQIFFGITRTCSLAIYSLCRCSIIVLLNFQCLLKFILHVCCSTEKTKTSIDMRFHWIQQLAYHNRVFTFPIII